MHKYTDTYCTYVHTHVATHCSHIICIQLTFNHNAPPPHTQANYMQVQTNNLSQRWIFVAPNELTLEYSLHGNIIEYGGQL